MGSKENKKVGIFQQISDNSSAQVLKTELTAAIVVNVDCFKVLLYIPPTEIYEGS